MKNHSKFLQFNDTNVLYTAVDGVTYIAVKPICEALNVAYAAQLRRLKSDAFLAPALSIWTIQVGDFQGREYTCISEKYVYGWIFSINSDKPELIEFKRTCYDLLYNHFHGVIGKRKEFLLGYTEKQLRIDEIKKQFLKDVTYQELLDLEAGKKQDIIAMKAIDKAVINQTELKFN